MKTNTKRLLSVLLCLAMVLAILPMAVFAETPTTLYVKPNSNWNIDSARFAAYFFNDSGNTWVDCTLVADSDGVYEVAVPEGYTSVIFCRMDPSTTENNWTNKWNQTADLTIPTDGTNCYVVADGTWDSGAGQWVEFSVDSGVGETEATTAYPYAYSVAGDAALCGSSWTPADTANGMTDDDGDGIYSITYTAVPAGTYAFKVTDGSWNNAWPTANYELTLTAECDVTINFNSADNTIEVVADSIGEPVVEPVTGTLYVVGTHNEWLNPDETYVMSVDENNIYTLDIAVEAGAGALKVTDGTWDNCWGGLGADGNYEYNATTAGTITVTFDGNTQTLTVSGDCLGEVVVDPVEVSYYVVGSMNEWTASEAYLMTANEDGTYTLALDLVAGEYEFKVSGTDESWYPSSNVEINVTADGTVTITFNPADGTVVASGDVLGEVVQDPMTITSMHVVGDLGLTGAEWDAAANQMSCAMGLYSITFEGVAAGTYEFKFAANGTWDLNWATGLAVTPGTAETVWFNPLGNSSVTVDADNSTVTITFDMTTMDLVTGEGATSTVTIEAPAVETEGELVLGDNVLTLDAGDTDGKTLGFTATEAGALTLNVTALAYDWTGEGLEAAPADQISMGWPRMYAIVIDGTTYNTLPVTVNVAAGQELAIQIYGFMAYATEFTLNLTMGEAVEVPADPGTSENPYVIETLPYDIVIEGTHDVYYTYTAEQDGVIVITKPENCLVSGLPNYVQDASGNYYVTVTAGDVVSINPWSNGEVTTSTYSISYGELPTYEDEAVYFDNSLYNWETVYAYAWDANGTALTAEWPGTAMTLGEDGLWTIAIPGNATYIQFNNGGTVQTWDLDFFADMICDGLNTAVYGTELKTNLYVAGSFNEWTANDSYIMTNNGDGTFTLVIENLVAGTYEFKVTDFGMYWYGVWGENVSVTTETFGNLTVNFNLNTQEITTSHEAVEVVAPTISLKYPTLLLEDVIKLNIYFTIDQDIDVAKMGLLTWTEAPTTVDITTAGAVIPGAVFDSSVGFYGVTTEAIPAQNLGDVVYFCIYAELADGSYAYGKQVSYSPTTYAYNQLKAASTTDAAKSLYVAILNYGAAAQTYLSYKTDALINASLTDEMKAYVNEYSSDMVHSVSMPDATKQGAMASNGGFSAKKPSISLDGAFAINYYFTPSAEVSGDVTFYYWNADDFAAVDVLSIDNATGSAVMTADSGVYGAAIEGIAAKDIDGALYACGVYTDVDGNTYSTGILPYSLGVYCGNQAVNGTEKVQPLAAAIAVYGYYAAAFFG